MSFEDDKEIADLANRLEASEQRVKLLEEQNTQWQYTNADVVDQNAALAQRVAELEKEQAEDIQDGGTEIIALVAERDYRNLLELAAELLTVPEHCQDAEWYAKQGEINDALRDGAAKGGSDEE